MRYTLFDRRKDEVLLLARLLLAALFVIFGWGKLAGFSGTVALMATLNLPVPTVAAVVVVVMEFFVGIAIVIGFYVVGKVHHALHTPLMSVTNAISGIIVVGALLQIGHHNTVITVLSFVAILLASINILGGFAVTRRMLGMFSKG